MKLLALIFELFADRPTASEIALDLVVDDLSDLNIEDPNLKQATLPPQKIRGLK